MFAHDCSRGAQLLGSEILAFSVNDLGPLLTLGLGLLRYRALHLRGQIDVFDFHHGDLDAPWIGALIQDFLELHVESLALREKIVQLHLTQHTTQRRLREL